MNTLQVILVVVAVLAMLKAVWIMAAPGSYKKIAVLWLRIAAQTPTLLPLLLVAIGIVLWGLVLIGQPLHLTLAILLGAFFVLAAGLYANQAMLKKVTDNVLLNRSPRVLRLLAVAVFVVAALVLWVALTGK